jgi:hypothetical protein
LSEIWFVPNLIDSSFEIVRGGEMMRKLDLDKIVLEEILRMGGGCWGVRW